jgi:hypothetical protein
VCEWKAKDKGKVVSRAMDKSSMFCSILPVVSKYLLNVLFNLTCCFKISSRLITDTGTSHSSGLYSVGDSFSDRIFLARANANGYNRGLMDNKYLDSLPESGAFRPFCANRFTDSLVYL